MKKLLTIVAVLLSLSCYSQSLDTFYMKGDSAMTFATYSMTNIVDSAIVPTVPKEFSIKVKRANCRHCKWELHEGSAMEVFPLDNDKTYLFIPAKRKR